MKWIKIIPFDCRLKFYRINLVLSEIWKSLTIICYLELIMLAFNNKTMLMKSFYMFEKIVFNSSQSMKSFKKIFNTLTGKKRDTINWT